MITNMSFLTTLLVVLSGSSLVSAGLYVPSRNYVFFVPRSLVPGDTVGVIHTLDSYVIPCRAGHSQLRLKEQLRSNVTAQWDGQDIVLKVMSNVNSWTLTDKIKLSLSLQCEWGTDPLQDYYKPLTTTELTFEVDHYQASKSTKVKKGRSVMMKNPCPTKSVVYEIIENSGTGVLDNWGVFRMPPVPHGQVLVLKCESCADHLTINETSNDIYLVSPPDRELQQTFEVKGSCTVRRDGQTLEERTFSIVVQVYDVDDSHPYTSNDSRQQLEEIVSPIKIGKDIVITSYDNDSSKITNNNSYKVYTNDSLGIIVLGSTKFHKDYKGKTMIKTNFSMVNKKLPISYVVDIVKENWKYHPHGETTMKNKVIFRYTFLNTHIVELHTLRGVVLDTAAAKFTLVTSLKNESEETADDTAYFMHTVHPLSGVLDMTSAGHVYVKEAGILGRTSAPSLMVKMIKTVRNVTIKEFDLTVRLTTNGGHEVNCDGSCSEHKNESACVTSCGYGAVSGKCEWYTGDNSGNYSQCTPSVRTCPDGFCSELEMLNDLICPQDCDPGAPRRNRSQPLDAETEQKLCLYDSEPCVSLAGQTGKVEDDDVICTTPCKTGLAVSITILLVAALTIGLGTMIWNRTRKRQPVTLKHVNSLVSMTAVPSDYIVDDARDLRQHANRSYWSPASGQCAAKIALGQDVFEDKWEFPRCYLTIEHVIGEGEFGQVVRAQAFMLNGQEGNTVVAVKMLKPDASGAEYQDLVSEFQLLKEVDHPNVIKLLGVCTQKGPLYVIVEYCELGSLRSFLRGAKLKSKARSWEDKQRIGGTDGSSQVTSTTRTLTFRDLLSFAWQIAKGMDYLASLKIVHRDLAARNVLVTEGLKMKISDFGLSRDVYEADAYLKMSKGRMPVKWMAPESLYAQIYTMKSDVWSYGIVLWEIVTLGASPYPGIPPERLFPLLSTGYRMDRPDDCPEELYAIMQKCWKGEPENRPNFSTLRDILDHLLQQKTDYLELSNEKYFISSLENDNRKPHLNPTYGNVCSINKCQPDAYVTSQWPVEEFGENQCPEMSKLLIPCENDLEVTSQSKRHSYCNDGTKVCDRLLVHENLTYV